MIAQIALRGAPCDYDRTTDGTKNERRRQMIFTLPPLPGSAY
ncbi:hypothetical protein X743_05815 [Mesorhizobium sp. LNHC252B00]|nr:hypothetical protein X743_05815 [Mesorhizobium sp. LNHC252B00]